MNGRKFPIIIDSKLEIMGSYHYSIQHTYMQPFNVFKEQFYIIRWLV